MIAVCFSCTSAISYTVAISAGKRFIVNRMNNILIPVFTDDDAKALPNVVTFLKGVKPKVVIVIHNPSVGINSASATAVVDAKINDLKKAKGDAITREDFAAAEKYKRQIEDATLERGDVLRTGWKSIPEASRNAIYDKMNEPMVGAAQEMGTRFTAIQLLEDQPAENLFITLANFGRAWPDSLPHGNFSIIWPQNVPVNAVSAAQEAASPAPRVTTAPVVKKSAVAPPLSPRAAREKQLKQFFTLKKAALSHGVPIEGRLSKDILGDVIAKEFGAVAA